MNFSTVTLQSGATGTGNGTPAAVYGQTTLGVQVTGITTATLTWEGTVDGTNWVSLRGVQAGTGLPATTATANGVYRLDVAGLHDVRARISSYSSGTITVVGVLMSVPHGSLDHFVQGAGASGSALTGNPVQIGTSDGTNTVYQTGNVEGTALASAVRAASTTSAAFTNHNCKGILLQLEVSANPGGAETLQLQLWSGLTGSNPVFASAVASAFSGGSGTQWLLVYPGAAAAPSGGFGDAVSSQVCPRTFKVRVAHSAAGNWTYVVTYTLMV